MIRKLQQKIVVIITLLLSVTMILLLGGLNVISQMESNRRIDDRLERISRNTGMNPYADLSPYKDEQNSYVDFFSVQLNYYNEIVSVTFNRDIVVQSDEIVSYVNEALSSGESNGRLGNYAFSVRKTPSGQVVVFLDITQITEQNRNFATTTVFIGIIAIAVFFLLSVALSFWLVRPVRETFDKQKLFISNASHELKTPLAVIKANSDVLEAEIGENKWLGYIRSESDRMSELVNELLCLARLDDKNSPKIVMEDLNLSDIVLQSALPFESRMFENGKRFDVNVQPDIHFHGDKSTLQHIVTILIDNAEKYSDDGGEIKVSLSMRGSKRVIEVYNTGKGIPKDRLDKIFERFYREDEARNSKSGGYGLGLAIARSGVEAHGGSIKAFSEYGKWVKFVVTL